MSDPSKPRTKLPRRPSRRDGTGPPWPNRPFNPLRDARIAEALERGDEAAALREFTDEPEFPEEPPKAKPV